MTRQDGDTESISAHRADSKPVLKLTRVVGLASDKDLAEQLQILESRNRVSRLAISPNDLGRRRFRVTDQHGTEFRIALSRTEQLQNGSILHIDHDGAVMVDTTGQQRLAIRAATLSGAMQLGWAAGHLHWKVRMTDEELSVLLEGPREDYLKRIEALIQDASVEVVEDQ